ncbi:hypothetical protein NHH88_11670 [Oxalobacteraceae bacterium OTU3CAMAD1]|nr:hypothetical protein NHH88_11670 [Oxalobacteraceae bacterium OTU3CAMAD1]
MFPGQTTNFTINALSSKTFSDVINGVITDKTGVVDANVTLSSSPPANYWARLQTRAGLTPGLHTGAFELKLCYDAPTVCQRPVEGSPWQLPYKITVLAQSDLHYGYWEAATEGPFSGGLGLGNLGNTLVVPSIEYFDGPSTWLSTSDGSTWEKLPADGRTVPTFGHALGGDGATLYMSGGRDNATTGFPYTNAVWKFNGSRWQQQTPAAEFSPRAQHVMLKLGADLYVMGGKKDDVALTDIWKSSDDGIHWRQLSRLPAAMGRPTCAVNWRGSLLVIGDTVMTSPDGQNWTARKTYPGNFPVRSTQCAVMNDRLFVNPSDGYGGVTYSTTDLQTWQPEVERASNPFDVPGMVVVNGRLVVVMGDGTSQRTVMRTTPATR